MIARLPPAARLIGIGWYFAICIVLGIGGGVALDKWLDTTPWLTLSAWRWVCSSPSTAAIKC